ncbi:MAG: pyridoxamine 5'-phosphate oxidase family protein [Novosphingobium sp.]
MSEELPGPVLDLMRSGSVAGYATVSAAGVPIDTPVLYFPSDDLATFNLTTGLAYPVKAERARRNPRVGMLLEGGPDEPVVSIAGMAAVRDGNLQANVLRYLAEAAHTLPHNPDWSLARQAVWYWTRIIVEVTPARVLWWDSPAAMDQPPHRWQAPADTTYPQSDPASPGKASQPASWNQPAWQDLAAQAAARVAKCHLSLIDAEGFPLPMPVRRAEANAQGFVLDLPRGIPAPIAGMACLTFGGIETFIGEISDEDGKATLHVERALPLFPMTRDMTQLWQPSADTRAQLMRRLDEETARRGQPIPVIPQERPEPSPGYQRRMARMKALAG